MTAHNNSNSNTKIVRLKDLLDFEDGAILELGSGADMNVEDGGNIHVKDGGVVNFESGSELQIDGVAVTASAADINNGVGSSSVENVNTANDGTVYTGSVLTKVNGDGVHNRFTLTLTNFALGNSADNASLGVGAKFFTLDAGVWAINLAHLDVGVTIADANKAQTPVIGIGTVVASGAVSVLSGTATFENIVTGAAVADCNGTHKLTTQVPTANKSLVIAAAGSHDFFLNVAAAWADMAAVSALTASGTIVIDAIKLA